MCVHFTDVNGISKMWAPTLGASRERFRELDTQRSRDAIVSCNGRKHWLLLRWVLLRGNETTSAFCSRAKIDAYLKRPVDPRRLVARVNSLNSTPYGFRRIPEPIRVDALVIDPSAYRVERPGR
jgi:hypothetical protein